jgi:hypothetical protein
MLIVRKQKKKIIQAVPHTIHALNSIGGNKAKRKSNCHVLYAK